MCVCIQSDIALPRATCGYRLGDQYFCSMPHVYVVGLTPANTYIVCVGGWYRFQHTCNVSIVNVWEDP